MFLHLVTMERGCEELLFTELELSHLKFLVLHVNLLAHHCLYFPPTTVILSQCCVTGDVSQHPYMRHELAQPGALSVDDSGHRRMSPLRLLHLNPPNCRGSSPNPIFFA